MTRAILATALALAAPLATADSFTTGRPDIKSMSALAFGPEGVLFVGDGKGGHVYAVDLGARASQTVKEPKEITDVEGKLAALLGANPSDVMIHDLAVDPLGKRPYLAVSRGRSSWNSQWLLPNDVADATVLVRFDAEGKPEVVDLSSVRHARVALPRCPGRRRRCGPTPSPTWPSRTARSTSPASRTRSSRPPCGRSPIPSRAPSR
jgi:hypothetical protein